MFSPRYTAHGNVRVRDLVLPAMVVLCCAACVSAGRPGGDSQVCSPGEVAEPTLEWFDSSSPPARGSVLVSHGLNNRPEIMTDLIDELTADGLDVLRVALPPECGDRSRAAARSLARRDFFAEVPTAVFVSKQDEFVSYRGVVDWVGANRLDAWSVVPVVPSPDRSRFRDHLLVLPEHVGEGPWRGMVDQIRALFAPVPEWPVPE